MLQKDGVGAFEVLVQRSFDGPLNLDPKSFFIMQPSETGSFNAGLRSDMATWLGALVACRLRGPCWPARLKQMTVCAERCVGECEKSEPDEVIKEAHTVCRDLTSSCNEFLRKFRLQGQVASLKYIVFSQDCRFRLTRRVRLQTATAGNAGSNSSRVLKLCDFIRSIIRN